MLVNDEEVECIYKVVSKDLTLDNYNGSPSELIGNWREFIKVEEVR